MIQVPERALAQDALDINADAAILVEASTGKILYAKNEDAALGIASMTKMMSEYLLFEAIHERKLHGIRNRQSANLSIRFPLI